MPYTAGFFDAIGPGSRSSAKAALPVVFDAIGTPMSMLDVGCGTAGWLAAAQQLGVDTVAGVDGHAPADQLQIPLEAFTTADLTQPLDLGQQFDLVMSLEVAEHLPPSAAATFVDSLARHGDVVLFSGAIPGQGGNEHLNEQWPPYWAELFGAHDFVLFDVVRPIVWDDDRIDYYYRQNMLLFARAVAAERLAAKPAPRSALNLVHPGTLSTFTDSGVRFAFKIAWGSIGRTLRKRLHR